jgi:type II secretory pathway component GspD/PulD (secretin)
LAQFVQVEQTTDENAGEVVADKAAAPAVQPPQAPTAPVVPTEKPGQAPPVTITVTEDGRLMLTSADPLALDRMEELIDQLSPPEKRYKVFRLKYISALNMKWNLEDFFADELKGDTKSSMEYDWYWGFRPSTGQDKGGTGLSKRKKLMLSWDTPSNTILVANASPSQMKEIEQLIAEYDQPAPEDSVRTRRTAWIKVKYSKASAIADSIKQVYRDLLSSKDKEFDRGGDERQRGQSQERVTVFRYGGSDSDGAGKRPTPMKVGFEGALSIGADDVSNMILVSVQEELYPSVVAMIKALDEEAAPTTTVQVHRVTGSVTAEALQKAIDQAMSKPWPGGRPEQQAGQGGRGRGEGGDRRRGDGDGRRDRRRGDGNNNNNNND